MVEQTYHEMLSTIVNALLHALLVVLTPNVRLHKEFHRARLTSRDVVYNEKKLLTTNMSQFINKLIEQNISFKLILLSVLHVQQTERSR